MSYANGTPFLNLAQTVGTDHRDWFDENEAKLNLDIKMKTLWDGAASTADILEQLQETVSGLDTDLASLTETVNGHTTTLQTVSESLLLINSALSTLNTNVGTKFDSAGIADPYDPTYGTYDVDDVVTYNGQRYKCVTAVTAAEPFDADKWSAEDVQTVINRINSNLTGKILYTAPANKTYSEVFAAIFTLMGSMDHYKVGLASLVRRNTSAFNSLYYHITGYNPTTMIVSRYSGNTLESYIYNNSDGSVTLDKYTGDTLTHSSTVVTTDDATDAIHDMYLVI